MIDTDMIAPAKEFLNLSFVPKVPMQRVGEPGEVANVIAFLASSRASYITAGNFYIDGGYSAV